MAPEPDVAPAASAAPVSAAGAEAVATPAKAPKARRKSVTKERRKSSVAALPCDVLDALVVRAWGLPRARDDALAPRAPPASDREATRSESRLTRRT